MRTGGRAKNIGWRLDYFVINQEAWKYVKESRINNDVFGSDHCPIELVVDFTEWLNSIGEKSEVIAIQNILKIYLQKTSDKKCVFYTIKCYIWINYNFFYLYL